MPLINNIEELLAFNHSVEQRAVDSEKEGKKVYPFSIDVKTHKKTRSIIQNDRHWAIMEQIAYWRGQQLGKHFIKEEAHQWFMEYFLNPIDYKSMNDGTSHPYYSSKGLKTFEFSDWDNEIEAHAATEWGITILGLEEWKAFKKASR